MDSFSFQQNTTTCTLKIHIMYNNSYLSSSLKEFTFTNSNFYVFSEIFVYININRVSSTSNYDVYIMIKILIIRAILTSWEALQMHEIELYLIQNEILQEDKIKLSFNIKPFVKLSHFSINFIINHRRKYYRIHI